ncbi:MAG TPA: hypothetical protein DD791_10515 [Syntrophomonas sp.]|nr:hypothetical protein [Syntrophomonas sp.]
MLSGLIKTETDHNGNTTSYTFDKLGRITSLKLPNYNTVDSDSYEAEQKYEYDYATCAFFDTTNANLITTSIYSYIQYKDLATGTIAKYDERESFYDGFGNLRLQDLWDFDRGEWVVQSQYHYDNLARPNYFIDAEGNSSTFAYNPWGILYKTVDPHANVYQTDYELIPRKYTSYFMQQGTTTRQNVVETSLDQWEQVVQKKAYPNWPNTADPIWETYTYDINGNAITHTDPNGNTTNYAYDQLDRITQVIDPLNQTTEYQYTVLGEIKSIKQSDGAKNWITSQEYDELARLTRKAAPSGAAEQFTPNALGLLQQRTDLNQNTFSYTYDAHKREINKTGPASSFAYTYYHPLGVTWIEQYNNNAQLIGLQGFNYNPKGQISYTIQYSDAYNHQTYYAYDKTGSLTSVRDPFSHTTLYGYNKNRLTRVQINGSATASTADAANARYEYYPNGMLKSVTYPQLTDGSYLKANYEYDDLNRLTKLKNTKGTQTLAEYTYTYDKNGNITSITDAAGTTTYTYDSLNRLTGIQRPGGETIAYTYDVRGNRSTVTNDTWSVNLEATNYTYNEWDQLTQYQTGTSAAAFQYGPTGLRSKKITPTETIRYHYNNNGEVIAESNASNTVTANYIWGPDRVLSKKEAGGNQYYYLYNGHGDVAQIVDTSGNPVNTYSYDEWGNILSQTEQINNPFKYAGEIHDPETGLYYLRARYYDPSLGRFINKDAYEGDITNPLTLNQYSYVYNNPIKYIDPSGNIGIRQIDNFAMGLLASGIEGIKDYKTLPTAIREISKAISQGSINLNDLAKAMVHLQQNQ